MNEMQVRSGITAMAEALRQIKPDVVAAHPVPPAADLLNILAGLVSNGQLDAEFIAAESDSSALSACIGASAASGRVFTVTASQGLVAMHELLLIAASLRLPIVAGITNRALAAPDNVNADHGDTMTSRDCGWIQLYCESPQEVYDTLIQAYRIAEHPDVATPVMVGMDAVVTSHSSENIVLQDSNDISDFIGKFEPDYSLLNPAGPVTIGSLGNEEHYFEQKINQIQGIENARTIIKTVGKAYGDQFGRYYSLFETYKMKEARYALLAAGSSAGTVKEAVDRMRAAGIAVGMVKMRVFRPFPYQELRESLDGLSAVAVLDRSLSPGSQGGPLFSETRTALYDAAKRPDIYAYTYGLGGRDISVEHIVTIIKELMKMSPGDSDHNHQNKQNDKIKEKVINSAQNTPFRFVNLRQKVLKYQEQE